MEIDNTDNERIMELRNQQILMSDKLKESIAHLDFMLDFYFKIIFFTFESKFTNRFQSEISHTVQMMFTKAKSFRVLLDGVSHKVGSDSLIELVDHTVLFTIARSTYEQLLSFELVYVIPDTEEKRKVMENAYIAASAVNRLSIANSNPAMRNAELEKEEQETIDNCRQVIEGTTLYKSLSREDKKEFNHNLFKLGKYQFVWLNDGKFIPYVGWDDIRKYCVLNTDIINGLYKFLCNMAHPSYLALNQFIYAYKDGDIYTMMDYATRVMNSILSVFIMDYMNAFPETQKIYDELDSDSQFVVSMYCKIFRTNSND